MSTNFKKQEEIAEKDLRYGTYKIIRKAKSKRVTKQIRLITSAYNKVQAIAVEQKKTLAKTLEEICRFYFKNH